MASFDDFSLNRNSAPEPEPLTPAPSGSAFWLIVAVVLIALALGLAWYFVTRSNTPPTPQTAARTVDSGRPPARRAGEPGEAIDLPPLDQSDALVRELAGRLSSHPVAAAWLATNGLIRNLTVVVTNIADGETPAKHLTPLRPTGPFSAKTSGGLTYIDPSTYHRYDGIAAAVDGLDARGVARFYATIKPRIDDAYRDLIGPDANFDQTLERAIVMLLRTPVVDQDIRLRTGKVSYPFADASLEDLTAVQRQFLRMGPRNMRIVKAKLRAVSGFIGIPDTALPPPDK